MPITFPPILIPVALLTLVFVLWKYWLPAQIKTTQINTGYSCRQVVLELIGIPLASFAQIGVALHATGNDTMLFSIVSGMVQGLIWCGQGLVWDILHLFAYG